MPVLEVQRYFFGVRWSDHEDNDPNGALLSDNAAALNYADRLIRELKERGRYNDPNLMVIVRDGMKGSCSRYLSLQRAPEGARRNTKLSTLYARRTRLRAKRNLLGR